MVRDIRYIISDASKKIGVEQYTLRYWEEELNLDIQRNEMGHRYYREEDLEMFKAIKTLKNQGYQLRAIKMLLPDIILLSKNGGGDISKITKLHEELDQRYMEPFTLEEGIDTVDTRGYEENEDIFPPEAANKIEQFRAIMSGLITEALEDNNERMAAAISESVTNHVIKEMDYLLRIKEEREEERFKRFDKTLREMQTSRLEIAATKIFKNKRRRFFNR